MHRSVLCACVIDLCQVTDEESTGIGLMMRLQPAVPGFQVVITAAHWRRLSCDVIAHVGHAIILSIRVGSRTV
jgi:hypothetical protein